MATLRPRIGKHNVKRGHRIDGQEPLNRIRNLEVQNADVGKARPLHFCARGADATKQALDSQEILVKIFCREFREKGAVTTPKVDLERTLPSVNSQEI